MVTVSYTHLYGILSAMGLLVRFMYGITVIVIFVITVLTGSRLLVMERKDMGIYRSIGFTVMQLRAAFALQFGIVSFLGAFAGLSGSAFPVSYTHLFL